MDATHGRRHPLDAAIAILLMAVAVALRVWHVRWGLPDFTEEAIPLQLGFAMRSVADGRIDPNPHAFSYPSLGIYLHLAVQQVVYLAGLARGLWSNAADHRLAFDLDPTPMVLAARSVGIACDALAVLAAWRIGRRVSRAAGLASALLIACSATFVTTARSIYVDSVMACLALWALERMLAWHAAGGRGRLVGAALLTGLAAGAKYPAAVLLLPLAALGFAREGPRAWRALALATALAALAFLATTPYALLDPHAFLRDLGFEGRHAAEGHLGSTGHHSFGFHLANLVRDLGWPAMVLLALAPLAAWRRPARRPVVLALALGIVVFGLPIALARIDAERYLLPVLACAAVLVAVTLATLVELAPARLRTACALALLAAVAAPPALAGYAAAAHGARDTQVEARRWCERHLPPDQLVVTEGYGPRLVDESRLAALREGPAYRHASAAWRARIDRLACWRVVALPLEVSGRLVNPVRLAGVPPVTLEVAPHVSALARVYYEPALFADADWIVTTGAVRGRYTADPVRFAPQCRFYHTLDRVAPVAARFRPGPDASGPEIVIHRVDAATRAELIRRGGLDPLWWTAAIPAGYRRQATRLLAIERHVRDSLLSSPVTPPRRAAEGALIASPRPLDVPELPLDLVTEGDAAPPGPRGPDGGPAPWVTSLRPMYQEHIASFAATMSRSLAMLGRYDAAARFAEANLVMMPEDVPSCLIASVSLGRTGRWMAARATIERTLAVLDPADPDPALALQYARALARTGEPDRARESYRRLIAALPAGDPLAGAATADLAALR